MNEREFEEMLGRLLRPNAERRQEFRDALLARCLAELGADGDAADLNDADLELLAAAGDLGAEGAPSGGEG